MGFEAEADKYTPALYASLKPDDIRKVEGLKGLERIYPIVQFESMVWTWRGRSFTPTC